MTPNPRLPIVMLFDIGEGQMSLNRLFACLDESALKGCYTFGRFDQQERRRFELFFRTEDDAQIARELWKAKCCQPTSQRASRSKMENSE